MDLRIDSHKLIYHPERVASWRKGEKILPINMEVCLAGACNHRCIFCCGDYLDYKPDFLPYDVFMENLREVSLNHGEDGVKSILFAGTGEPLLHPRFIEVINGTKECGVDVALSTNGVLFIPEKADATMASISWIRFSVSGGTEETYKKIHRGRDGDLQRVFDNIRYAAELKRKNALKTVLNVQIVMIPENVNEVLLLAKRVKGLGADNFIVKSYGIQRRLMDSGQPGPNAEIYTDSDALQAELTALNDEKFRTIYRTQRIKNEFSKRKYHECYASPFHAFIAADGGVYPCCEFPGMNAYCFGNVTEISLKDIFMDRAGRRQSVLGKLKEENLAHCKTACKLDVMNQYLDELVHPREHVNFI